MGKQGFECSGLSDKKSVMGIRVSSAVGCLIPNKCSNHGDSAAAALGIHYYDPPPDEGLGHSFYYVRPANFGSDSSTPLEFLGSGMAEPDGAAAIGSGGAAAAAATVMQADQGSGFGRGEVPGEQQHKRSATTRVSWERVPGTTSRRAPPGSSGSETSRPKSMSETSFKVISGASVSANTATPRSITSQEQFNSFSNILFDRASAFESTSSYPCSLSLVDPFQILALSQALSPLEFPPQGPHWRGDSYQVHWNGDSCQDLWREEFCQAPLRQPMQAIFQLL